MRPPKQLLFDLPIQEKVVEEPFIPSIKELRESGYKVRVHHWRLTNATVQDYKGDIRPSPMLKRIQGTYGISLVSAQYVHKGYLSPRGGKTEIFVRTPYGDEFSGKSVCSIFDNFDRREGNKIALKDVWNKIQTTYLQKSLEQAM